MSCVCARVQPVELAYGGADAAGRMQSTIASFLLHCPDGLVVLEGIQLTHPAALPALITMLGEEGHFEQDGRAIPAWRAIYVATLRVPAELIVVHAAHGDEEALKSSVKSFLVQRLVGTAAELGVGIAAGVNEESQINIWAAAVRRRFDFVGIVNGADNDTDGDGLE